MIDIDILFYDSIICSNIGFYFFIIGLIQICREPENYGIIGYIYHRIYTTIGFIQMFHITRIIDNSIINRIFNQLIFEIESMTMMLGILIFNIFIMLFIKNIITNGKNYNWYDLHIFHLLCNIILFSLIISSTCVSTVLRFFYHYDLWTVLNIGANLLCFVYITISLYYYGYIFYKYIHKIIDQFSFSNERILNSVYMLKQIYFFYTILIIPTFYFLIYYINMYSTKDTLNMNDFDMSISYFRYIILTSCFIMCWFTYIHNKQLDQSPIIRPCDARNSLHDVFI